MLYCQQCGAGNAGDARFCNQCGAKIARVGEPGGPLAASADGAVPEATLPIGRKSIPSESALVPTTPPRPLDVSTISLSAIGVRSRGQAWGIIAGIVLALVGLGAGGMWLAMRFSSAPAAVIRDQDVLPVEPQEVEVDLIPHGEEPPDLDVVTTAPRPTPRSRRGAPREARESARPARPAETPNTARREAERPRSDDEDETTAAEPHAPARAEASGRSDETGPSSASSARPEPDWDALAEQQRAEDDYEMEAYATRVRRFVRTYYLRRAQSCFERETRNAQSVRGTVVIEFEIQADGEIANTRVVRNTTELESLGACLARQVDSWRLPPPPEGEAPLAMQMPFSR